MWPWTLPCIVTGPDAVDVPRFQLGPCEGLRARQTKPIEGDQGRRQGALDGVAEDRRLQAETARDAYNSRQGMVSGAEPGTGS